MVIPMTTQLDGSCVMPSCTRLVLGPMKSDALFLEGLSMNCSSRQKRILCFQVYTVIIIIFIGSAQGNLPAAYHPSHFNNGVGAGARARTLAHGRQAAATNNGLCAKHAGGAGADPAGVRQRESKNKVPHPHHRKARKRRRKQTEWERGFPV